MAELVDSYVKLLLPFSGADGATADIDHSGENHVPTFAGNAQLDTARYKFAPSALLLDGNGDYLTFPASADWDFAGDDLTVDFWHYTGSIQRQYFYGPGTNSATHYGWGLDMGASIERKLGLWASSTGNSWDMINSDPAGNGICATAMTINQWNHIAVTRSGDDWRVFLNGIVDLNINVAGVLFDRSGTLFNIGRTAYLGGRFFEHGSLAEFRVSKGIARWTANFTPPPYPYHKIAQGRTL